ncbi:DMT family transporter [Temperatibacter marinus]|uniref:DMT family transporter n=1 Tax=Temperatibacter marinus TaxID=1456591 RepID=A0AA52EJN7_9PROT|nr:DMT family transporter [Temperatibacter marinus]WND03724.1 DMT family transporter [Temperatibacter marinus]
MIDTNLKATAFFAMIIGGLLIAFSPIFMRFSLNISDVSPSAAAFWRVSLALPILFLLMVWQKKSLTFARPKNFLNKDFFLIGLFFAGDLAFWHWSIAYTTVANATLLANLASSFTAIIGYFFFKERFSRTFIGGLVLAIIGAITLMGHSLEASPENFKGDILGILTALCYASYIIATNKARKRWSTLDLMFYSGVFTALLLFPVGLLEDKAFTPEVLLNWWPLLSLSWVSHLLGQSMIMYGLAHISATLGSVSLLIQPVIATLLAALIFDEQLVIYHLTGGVMILTGIYICKKG